MCIRSSRKGIFSSMPILNTREIRMCLPNVNM
jgi:hypothetical protein